MPLLPLFRERIAQQLTSVQRRIVPVEVSIRVLTVDAAAMISPFEMEIKAQQYSDRVKRCDEICLHLKEFVLSHAPYLPDVSVWLELTELGHSFIDATGA
ncbi:MAG: hypothetical protein C0469_09610 [Cyanobacteria bacterium DS2.3.42]|nr:hypothetical protein [Cyanobacteria bacterium DS2.3.42]